MRVFPVILLFILISGCVQQQEQPKNETPSPVVEEPSPVVGTKTTSVLVQFGLSYPYSPTSSSWVLETAHKVDRCTADLTQTDGACPEQKQTTDKTTTWCEDKKTLSLSTKCYYSTAEELRSSITSQKDTIIANLTLYSPATVTRLTYTVNERYDWGTLTLVYTTHGRYPNFEKVIQIDGKPVFCEDAGCNKMFLFIDSPSKYVWVSTSTFSDTSLRVKEIISLNYARIYQTDLRDGFKLFSGQFAYNHGVMACVNKFGIMRAEPAYFDWPKGEVISDGSKNIKVYAPFSFFYSPDFWKTPASIGSQIDVVTREYNTAERFGNSYKLCPGGSLPQCSEACASGNALAIGKCPSPSEVPMEDVINEAVDVFNRVSNSKSLSETSCFVLLNSLGEDRVVHSAKTGKGMIFVNLPESDPTILLIFEGDAGSAVIKSAIEDKYSFKFNFVYQKTVSNCDIFSYEYGHGAICKFPKTTAAIYNYCSPKEKCSGRMEELVSKIALPWQ